MTLYRIDEKVLDNYIGFDFDYAEEIGVLVKVEPTDRILWCPSHRSRQKNRTCEKANALWEAGQMYLLEGEECSFIEVDLVRVDDPYKEPSFIDGRNI
ncbi:MAG: hypothetical protein DRQ56_10545 [Gammaproteobacteria bacterium]|nr:MAG: hypothetical protein DRQ56_10545 [Gammaproteobacteria bacterium]